MSEVRVHLAKAGHEGVMELQARAIVETALFPPRTSVIAQTVKVFPNSTEALLVLVRKVVDLFEVSNQVMNCDPNSKWLYPRSAKSSKRVD